MSLKGWVVLHRKLLDWEWYQDPHTKSLFLHCLLKANFEAKMWRGTEIKRGEFVTSVANLSSELGLTTQQTRTSIKKLLSTNEITIKTNNKFSLISVTYYEKYQDDNKQPNNQITNEQQAEQQTNQQTNNNNVTIKQINKITNKQNNISSQVCDSPSEKLEKIKYRPEHEVLAIQLSNPVKQRFPKHKIDIAKWAEDIEKIERLESYPLEKLCDLWSWIQNHEGKDGFTWARQILSPGKLRKRDGNGLKYIEKLTEQMNFQSSKSSSGLTAHNVAEIQKFLNRKDKPNE